VVAVGGQKRLVFNGQELWPEEALRQSVAGKDVNTVTEESVVLKAVTKQRLAKTYQTEKTYCLL
jgi:hypothetical protein